MTDEWAEGSNSKEQSENKLISLSLRARSNKKSRPAQAWNGSKVGSRAMSVNCAISEDCGGPPPPGEAKNCQQEMAPPEVATAGTSDSCCYLDDVTTAAAASVPTAGPCSEEEAAGAMAKAIKAAAASAALEGRVQTLEEEVEESEASTGSLQYAAAPNMLKSCFTEEQDTRWVVYHVVFTRALWYRPCYGYGTADVPPWCRTWSRNEPWKVTRSVRPAPRWLLDAGLHALPKEPTINISFSYCPSWTGPYSAFVFGISYRMRWSKVLSYQATLLFYQQWALTIT